MTYEKEYNRDSLWEVVHKQWPTFMIINYILKPYILWITVFFLLVQQGLFKKH
jgi:hypothetical protein